MSETAQHSSGGPTISVMEDGRYSPTIGIGSPIVVTVRDGPLLFPRRLPALAVRTCWTVQHPSRTPSPRGRRVSAKARAAAEGMVRVAWAVNARAGAGERAAKLCLQAAGCIVRRRMAACVMLKLQKSFLDCLPQKHHSAISCSRIATASMWSTSARRLSTTARILAYSTRLGTCIHAVIVPGTRMHTVYTFSYQCR